MAPLPRPAAVCAYVGAGCMVVIAVLRDAMGAATLASGLLLALAAAFAWTFSAGVRLRNDGVRLALQLGSASGRPIGLIAGATFHLRVEIYNPSRRVLHLVRIAPMLPSGLESREAREHTVRVAPHSRASLPLALHARAAGRYVVHGVAVTLRGPFGAFDAPVYFPAPLAVRVLPRGVLGPPLIVQPSSQDGSAAFARSPGFGIELHELREHRPGDPFNAIAWKPSARLGKLVVREHEHDRQAELSIVLDASGSMREGEPGSRAIDPAIELCFALAQRAIDAGDRVGLVTVDTRVTAQMAPRAGKAALQSICDLLLQATEVVDENRTAADEQLLFERVSEHLKRQLGLDFVQGGRLDRNAVLRHVEHALQQEDDQSRRTIIASSPVQLALRHFCRARGIALPARPPAAPAEKQAGLAGALRLAAGRGQLARSVIAVSDLSGLGQLDALLRSAALLQAQRHLLTFIVAETGALAIPGTPAIERVLDHIDRIERRQQTAARVTELRRAGIAVWTSSIGNKASAQPRRATRRRAA